MLDVILEFLRLSFTVWPMVLPISTVPLLLIVGGLTAIWGVAMLIYLGYLCLAQWAQKTPSRQTIVLTTVILIAVAPIAAWSILLEVKT